MKDLIGREINIGDSVACRARGYSGRTVNDMVLGKVVSIGAKQITVVSAHKKRPSETTKHYHYPENVVIVQDAASADVLSNLVKFYKQEIESFDSCKFYTDAEFHRGESRYETLKEIVADLKVIVP